MGSITASTDQSQAAATPITDTVTRVICANPGDTVQLPDAAEGTVLYVGCSGNDCRVYVKDGTDDKIGGTLDNVILNDHAGAVFFCPIEDNWFTTIWP